MISQTNSDAFSKTWQEKPDVIRAFVEMRPQYEQLCSEVEYILKKRMDEANIEYSAVSSRAKSLKSFAEKLTRKHYDDPLNNITDLAGVRLIYLYKSDRSAIEKIVESEFEVIEKIDKVEEQEADRFGYGALHYLVHIGRKSSGARYDDLKRLICEVQVRTVLQDAWAIINHHLSYKQESDVPRILRRKLNSVSGLFETADDQFDRIRSEREAYKETIKSKLNDEDVFLKQEMNLDTLAEFLNLRFPQKQQYPDNEILSLLLSRANEYGYASLSDLDRLLKRTQSARAAMSVKKQSKYKGDEVMRAVALEHPEFRKVWDPAFHPIFEECENLLSKQADKLTD